MEKMMARKQKTRKVQTPKKVYKILDLDTGLYSRGGSGRSYYSQAFSTVGKSWTNIGHVKNHLHCAGDKYKGKNIVVQEFVLVFSDQYPLQNVIDEMKLP